MSNFYWVHKDYNNESLNAMARRLTEHNTANLICSNKTVHYVYQPPTDTTEYSEVGIIQLPDGSNNKDVSFPYTVQDVHVINDIFNYNLYFVNNTEPRLQIDQSLKGTFDCLVSLGAGSAAENNPIDCGLTTDNHYVIDISPTAIHKTMNLYKDTASAFEQLDVFNIQDVKAFLKRCQGSRGLFVVSNCFNYLVNSLLYDVSIRLELQNKFIDALVEDDKEWYVSIYTADGTHYHCVKASEIKDRKLDKRFEVLPWISK